MPFQQIGNESLSETFELRLSPSDKAWICEQAKLCGMSMAEFIRRRALGLEIVAKSDLVMKNDLNRLGGMLKKSLNDIKSESGQQQVFMTMAAIRDLKERITRGDKKDQESKQVRVEGRAYRKSV